MAISSTTRRWQYSGNDVTTAFAYTTRIRDEDHLTVTLTSTAGVETVKTITTHYTVSGVGVSSGGNVTMVTAPATGETLTIEIIEPLTQTTDIRNQGSFLPETHEDAFDHFIRVDQQQQQDIDGSVKLPTTLDDSEFDPTFPTDLVDEGAERCPMVNEDGDGWADAEDWPSAADIAAAATNAASAAASAAAAANSAGINSPYGQSNIGIAASVATSALTIALKQADGSTNPATTTGAVRIYFRSATLTTGSLTERTVTGALSVVVPSGATLGHNDALADYIYVYAIDNAGTVELAVSSSSHWDEGSRVSTTAIDTNSDDAATMYSTSARTNVACRLIGRLLSTQTTAGTWASAMTEVTVGFLEQKADFIQARAANFKAKHGIIYEVSTASARTVTLSVARSGLWFILKDSTEQATTNNITLARAASESIEGVAANYALNANGGSWRVWCNGTNWFLSRFLKKDKTSITVFTGNASAGSDTIPTTFASPTLGTPTYEVGSPLGLSTNTITFPHVGNWFFDVWMSNVASNDATERNVGVRLRNTTDTSTETSAQTGKALAVATGGNPQHFVMSARLDATDITKNYEVQFAASGGTPTITNTAVDGSTGRRWKIKIFCEGDDDT